MARNTVLTRRVCGVLLMSINPCEMSDTQTKAAFVCILASASSKPSSPETRQKVKCLDRANLLRLVRSSKNDVASQLKVSLFFVCIGFSGVCGRNGNMSNSVKNVCKCLVNRLLCDNSVTNLLRLLINLSKLFCFLCLSIKLGERAPGIHL